ncbi:MAG: YaaA family protein [Butyricicoccus pullicaecorum]|nr:YaaA family protein [Butyricicoccus pullicaecorum]
MIAILSPAKNMRTAPERALTGTEPLRREERIALYETLRNLPAYELESIMKISPDLALKAAADFASWKPDGGQPAILSYDGLAYKNLDADTLSDADLEYAQAHLRHLSALYGVLRPLDLIRPYRLEMGQRPKGCNLYTFWGSKLRDDLYGQTDLVINLASNEYSKAVSKHLHRGDQFLTCEFLSERKGKLCCLAARAKMARGAMARYIIRQRVDRAEGLMDFKALGFIFEPALSNGQVYTYVQRS